MYGVLRMGDPSWPNPQKVLDIPLTALNTFVLICSSLTMVKAFSAAGRGDGPGLQKWLLATIAGGATFLGIQAYEWTHLITHGSAGVGGPLTLKQPIGATFYILTGFHGFHVLSGVIYLTVIRFAARDGRYLGPDKSGPVEITGLYWHFVDLIWILVFTFVYLL
jgi:heme/copper-type cytochrome/quinol oxidase subunit 3